MRQIIIYNYNYRKTWRSFDSRKRRGEREKKFQSPLDTHTCIDHKNFRSCTLEKYHPRSDGNARPINQMTRNIKGPIEFPGKTWTRPHKRGETWRSPNHRVHLSRIIEWSKLILSSVCMYMRVCVCISTLSLSLSLSLSRSPSPFARFSFNVNFNRAQLIDVYRPKKCIRWRLNEFRSFFSLSPFLSFFLLLFHGEHVVRTRETSAKRD